MRAETWLVVMRTRLAVMRTTTRLAVILLAANASIAGADELKPFEATYAWMWNGMTVAVSHLKLEQHGDTWVYTSRSDPRGIGRMFSERPLQQSTMQVTPTGVRPLRYKAESGTSSTKRDADVQFDWDHNRATGIYEGVKVDMPLQPGIQDDLSVQIALMVELLAGRTPAQFLLIDKNTVREYRYTRDREESISTSLGKIDTVVYRSQKKGSPRMTRFWCAPSRGYIPMRVQQDKDGEIQWSLEIQSLRRD